jgi:hypothetical protein
MFVIAIGYLLFEQAAPPPGRLVVDVDSLGEDMGRWLIVRHIDEGGLRVVRAVASWAATSRRIRSSLKTTLTGAEHARMRIVPRF